MAKVFIDIRLEKKLKQLNRSGKKGILAANKASNIIHRLQKSYESLTDVGNLTKHGEHRLKSLIKYDLGRGYRLLCYKNGTHLYFLFVGTHDESHCWIEKNKDLSIENIEQRCRCIATPKREIRKQLPVLKKEAMIHSDVDEDALNDLSDLDIRSIFRGLIESVQKKS